MGTGNASAVAYAKRSTVVIPSGVGGRVRVAIDGSSARTGGGVTYLREMLPRLRRETSIEIGPILLRREVAAALDSCFEGSDIVLATGRTAARSSEWLEMVRRSGADVVFAPTEISFVRYGVPLVLMLRNAAVSSTTWREYSYHESARFIAQRSLARLSRARASAYIAVSDYAAELGATALDIDSERVTVVHHGGPATRIPVKLNHCRSFLLVSNLHRYKNPLRLLSAFALVDAPWRLRIVGHVMERKLKTELDALVQVHNLSDRVEFCGYLSGVDLERIYSWADCFVWPSYAETFSHPLLEAHAHGLPILAARAASNAEIAGEAAVYFDPFDIGSIRSRLESAVEEGVRVGALPRSYCWSRCATETAGVLRQTARQR